MRNPSDLLYGSRRRSGSSKAIALRRAARAIADGFDSRPAAYYFLSYPDEILSTRHDDLFFSLITPALRRAKDIYGPEPLLLREEMNAAPLSPADASEERLRLRDSLRRCSSYQEVVPTLTAELNSFPGPLALRALSYTGLKAQLAAYFTSTFPWRNRLENYLAWRLLARAEEEGRVLASTLGLLGSSQPAVGDAAGQLHYIVGREFAVCDLEMSLSLADRGDWRDKPEDRCPTCEKMLPSLIPPGSDDSQFYTLLSGDNYQDQLDVITEIIREKQQHYKRGEEEAIKQTLEDVDGHALTLAPLHRQEIASLFAQRFNDAGGDYRRSYLEDFAGDEFVDRYNRSLFATGEPYLETSEVAAWLSGWMDERFYLTAYQIEQNIENNVRHWLAEQQLIGKFR